jgi:hypothetical protein
MKRGLLETTRLAQPIIKLGFTKINMSELKQDVSIPETIEIPEINLDTIETPEINFINLPKNSDPTAIILATAILISAIRDIFKVAVIPVLDSKQEKNASEILEKVNNLNLENNEEFQLSNDRAIHFWDRAEQLIALAVLGAFIGGLTGLVSGSIIGASLGLIIGLLFKSTMQWKSNYRD